MQVSISARNICLLCALLQVRLIHAQVDPQLAPEVNAIRAEVARSTIALRRYTWTEHVQVLVNGKVHSSSDSSCRYDDSGQIVKVPLGTDVSPEKANEISKRPSVRAKGDLQDYIRRTITLVGYYVPPSPEQLDAMLARGEASLDRSESVKSHIRFKNYHQRDDTMTFTYDAVSKVLLQVTVLSSLGGSSKDPVTMDAVFDTLPDGVNHLATITVTAKSKKIEVRTQNVSYAKVN
jgi:hypothetical protein